MKTKILGLLAVALLVGPMAASAAVRTYDFTVNGGSTGPLVGLVSSGYFSIDESIIPSGGGSRTENNLLTDLSFNWNGISFDESNTYNGTLTFDSSGNLVPDYSFGTGCNVGLCAVSNNPANQWWVNVVISSGQLIQSFIYSTGTDIYRGTFTATLRAASVPEPGTLALLGLGLAGLGLSRRRKAA